MLKQASIAWGLENRLPISNLNLTPPKNTTMQKSYSSSAIRYALVITAVLSVFLISAPQPAAAQAQELPQRPATQDLLPETTVGMMKLRNFSEFVEKMKNSSTGQMFKSESVAPLVDSVYNNATRRYDEISEDVGLSMEELQSLPSGEITFAVIAPRRKDLQYVVMMETDEDNEAVDKAFGRGREMLAGVYEDEGVDFQIESTENDFGVNVEKVLIERTEVYICKHEGLLIGCTSQEELENMFVRWSGAEVAKVRALSENRKFLTIAKRCSVSDDVLPDARFFFDPIGIFKAASRGNVGANFAVAMLPTLGLDGVLAVGGNMYVDHDVYESISHGHLLLASPREGVLNALAMKPDSYSPEPWVPVDVANYMTTSWDVPQMLASIQEISDKIVEGKYEEFFDNMQEEIKDVDVDVREDLIANLSGRFSFIRPILSGSQLNGIGNVAGVGISDIEKMEEALDELMSSEQFGDFWAEREFSSIKYWSISEEAVTQREDQVKARVERRKKRAADRGEEIAPYGPRPEVRKGFSTFGIIGEDLVYSDSEEFFKYAVETFNGDKPALADDEDFLKNADRMTKMLKSDLPAAVFHADTRRELGFYLKALSNDNMMRVLDAQAEKDDNGFFADMKASIDEHGFPEAEDIEQYLSTSGGFITTDDSGYHFLLFQEKPSQE